MEEPGYTQAKCRICGREGLMRYVLEGRDVTTFKCSRCGKFAASGSAWAMLESKEWTNRQVANASGWIREHQNIEITSRDIEFLASLRAPSVNERAARILVELDRRSPVIGTSFDFSFNDSEIEWLAISWSVDGREVAYLFTKFLLEHGLIGGQVSETIGRYTHLLNAYLTPQGYEQVERMRGRGTDSQIGFCAMWFSPKLLPVWQDGVAPAIREAGYEPQRIDRVEHNNKIDDEIIAMIRKSRFVVADFTGNRGGVYFEAGFAKGLDIPVIWTIRSGRFHRVHFDNRQYNFIDWSFDRLDDFRDRLRNRIEATLGRGPLQQGNFGE